MSSLFICASNLFQLHTVSIHQLLIINIHHQPLLFNSKLCQSIKLNQQAHMTYTQKYTRYTIFCNPINLYDVFNRFNWIQSKISQCWTLKQMKQRNMDKNTPAYCWIILVLVYSTFKRRKKYMIENVSLIIKKHTHTHPFIQAQNSHNLWVSKVKPLVFLYLLGFTFTLYHHYFPRHRNRSFLFSSIFSLLQLIGKSKPAIIRQNSNKQQLQQKNMFFSL